MRMKEISKEKQNSYSFINCTSLEKLPIDIQEFILKCIENGIKKKIIYDFKLFRKTKYCIYTSQMLSVASNFRIKVVEGITIGPNGEHWRHSWNYYKGHHFNLIKEDNLHLLHHYGKFVPTHVLSEHLQSLNFQRFEFVYKEPSVPENS